MGFLAERAGNRMGMRQGYRTMARMQRRRTGFQAKRGIRQDFQPADEPGQAQEAPPPPPAPAQPSYVTELQQLASLRDQGVISPDDFEAKKKQLLAI